MAVELGSEHPCCNHTRQFFYLPWCLNFDKCDKRYCAEPVSKSLAAQTIALGVPTARAGRKQVVDHSEQCRFRMKAVSVTTTEGNVRLERAEM